jgi:hypothetical protein
MNLLKPFLQVSCLNNNDPKENFFLKKVSLDPHYFFFLSKSVVSLVEEAEKCHYTMHDSVGSQVM